MTECILHPGCVDAYGYGRRRVGGVVWRAHRLAWTEQVGPIPDGMDVLHHCDNPPCINVEHLFLGTNADNVADKVAKGRARGNTNTGHRVTHCVHGHEYTDENAWIDPQGVRRCRLCRVAKRQATNR